jgi:hypothetical protein
MFFFVGGVDFFEVEVERSKKNGESASSSSKIGKKNVNFTAGKSIQTHSVHRELARGLVHEHQDPEQEVVGQVPEGEAVLGSGGEITDNLGRRREEA